MPPVCLMNRFNIFCFWASLCVFRQCVFSSLFNIFCFRASFCRCGRVVFVSFSTFLESFQHFLLPGWLAKIPPMCLLESFPTFPASGLASEVSGNVPSWSKSQDHHTTLEASPDAQRMLHGKLLWSCIRHHPAKICVAGYYVWHATLWLPP